MVPTGLTKDPLASVSAAASTDESLIASLLAKAKDPKVREALQKAMKDPGMMAAIKDFQKTGPGCLPKYTGEVKKCLVQCQSVLV